MVFVPCIILKIDFFLSFNIVCFLSMFVVLLVFWFILQTGLGGKI